jgi:exosortase/archaeosortase family protein
MPSIAALVRAKASALASVFRRGSHPTPASSEGRRGAAVDASERRSQVRFAVTFALVAALASLAYYFPYPSGSAADVWMASYLRAYVRCAGALLARLDGSVTVSGLEVHGRFPFRVTRDCDGMQIDILFGAAVLAFPSTWARRLAGLAVGFVFLAALNLVRLCTLYFVGVYWPEAFDAAHRELWPLLLVIAALGAFLAWAEWLRRDAAVSA